MPAYYTKTEEERPVFHTTAACKEARGIERGNVMSVNVLAERQLCDVCAKIEAKKTKKAK